MAVLRNGTSVRRNDMAVLPNGTRARRMAAKRNTSR